MKLALGTVQFGLNYGINNQQGKPLQAEVNAILDLARESQLLSLDTSINYGDALKTLSAYPNIEQFQISSKFSSKDDLGLSITEQVTSTLKQVKAKQLNILYFHHFPDVSNLNYLREFVSLKAEGLIENIGISIYSLEEMEQVIDMGDVDCIQLPFNLLDRSKEKLALMQKAKDRGQTLVARSIFLQGLFFKDLATLPEKLAPLKSPLESLHRICERHNINMMELALGYSLNQPLLDQCLIGVDSKGQLARNLVAAKKPLTGDIILEIESINIEAQELLSPANWN